MSTKHQGEAAGESEPIGSVDVVYQIQARSLPVDHAFDLGSEVARCLPWFTHEPGTGLHLIQVAPSANGWVRPQSADGGLLHPSRRTRLVLRVPRARQHDCEALCGCALSIGGHSLRVQSHRVRPLSPSATLFARHVALQPELHDEVRFIEWVTRELGRLGIVAVRILCGMSSRLTGAERTVLTRAVLVAEVDSMRSLVLQAKGVGPCRRLGCGVFTPHKSIGPVESIGEGRASPPG